MLCRCRDDSVISVTMKGMQRSTGRAHVVRVKRSHLDKQGRRRDYESVYLRRTFREGPKVRNETLANLSKVPAEAVAALEATLKGQTLVPAGGEFSIARSLPHGHVAAVAAMARRAGVAHTAGAAVPVAGHRCRADRFAGDPTRFETVHAGLVARHHPGRRPGCRRRLHR